MSLSRRPLLALALCASALTPSLARNTQPHAPVAAEPGIPQPASVQLHSGFLLLDGRFHVQLTGYTEPRLDRARDRFLEHLTAQTGILFGLEPAGNSPALVIHTDKPSAPVQKLGEDESYQLTIDSAGARITAANPLGAMHGLQTLLQRVQTTPQGFALPFATITDQPRFPWRGLMIDCSRHFIPLPVIFQNLDAMEAVKLNVFHWHLTEDQGFRIESRVFPRLQQMGSNGHYYTQQQVREVIAYASARGIRVVPEFDMPGHATSWMVGYPHLGSAPGPYSVETLFGIFDAALDPTRESTYRFLDAFLGEMAGLFPDPYMHIGGDESNGKAWRANPRIRAFMKAHGYTTTQQLQTYFETRVQRILARHHKRMLGWDEILNPALPKNAVIQVWHGDQFLIEGAQQGHRELYSRPYYLDHMDTAAEMFQADPIPAAAKLTPAESKLILGGEACMWSEQVTPQTVDSRIWPRTAAVAERLWSPASDRDTNDMYRRLQVESLRLDGEGLDHITDLERGLRQLAGTDADAALILFAHTLEPIDNDARYRAQHPTQLTPFDLLVDAVSPDPPLRHQLNQLVDRALHGDNAAAIQLRAIFQSWAQAAPEVAQLAAGSPRLQQASERIRQWPRLATAGLESLDYLKQAMPAPVGWQTAQKTLIQDAAGHQDLVNFAVLPAIRKLVDAAGSGAVSLRRSSQGGIHVTGG